MLKASASSVLCLPVLIPWKMQRRHQMDPNKWLRPKIVYPPKLYHYSPHKACKMFWSPNLCAGATVPWPGCEGNWLPSTLAAQMLRLVRDPSVRPFQHFRKCLPWTKQSYTFFLARYVKIYVKISRLPTQYAWIHGIESDMRFRQRWFNIQWSAHQMLARNIF